MPVWDAGPVHAFTPDPDWYVEFEQEQLDAAALDAAPAKRRWEIMKIRVHGIPAPQGSKRPVRLGKGPTSRIGMVESSAKVKPWREAVRGEVQRAFELDPTLTTIPAGVPVIVTITFIMPRPRDHFGTGRNADRIKDTAPKYHTKQPDKDKLERSTMDALTMGHAFADDCQVAISYTEKVYASEHEHPGAVIEVTGVSSG